MVYKDLRLFKIILGQGFKEFSQELINISVTYGFVSIDNLFSHLTTISRNVIKEAESVKSALTFKLKDIF